MQKREWRVLAILLMVPGLMLMTTSCAKKVVRPEPVAHEAAKDLSLVRTTPQPEETPPIEQGRIYREEPGLLSSEALAARKRFENEDIYFAYDSAALTPEAQQILRDKAAWLRQNGGATIIIEGHCDERGTNEYNLALGDRRAESVKSFLGNLGVSPPRIATISYGEERPLNPGHSESAWARNRRAHFIIQ